MSEPVREELIDRAAEAAWQAWPADLDDPSWTGLQAATRTVLDAAGVWSLLSERDQLREALKQIANADVIHVALLPHEDSRSCPVCEVQRIARAVLGEPVPEESNDE